MGAISCAGRETEQCVDGVERRGDAAAQVGRAGSSIQDHSTSMNPPTRNRVTDSGVRLATGRPRACHVSRSPRRPVVVPRGTPSPPAVSPRSARCCGTWTGARRRSRTGAGCVPGHRRRLRRSPRRSHGECGRDRVVAIPEVLVEDLPAYRCAGDDVADRHLVDRTLMGQRERGLPQAGADPLGAGIGAMCSCCHASSVSHFGDS